MHKLIDYICDEMEELERKAEKGGKLSMQEVQYADTLAHLKKNILTSDAMMEAEDEYSNDDGRSYAGTGSSYARGGRGRGRYARRDSMGRYSSRQDGYYNGYSREGAKEDLRMELQELERNAKDEETRHMIDKWMKQLEQD